MKTLSVTFASAFLFIASAMAEEIVLPPWPDEIDAFNACLKGKASNTCVLPTRSVYVVDYEPADLSSVDEGRIFYQSPPDEEYRGQANGIMRELIRGANGYRTYQWGFVRTQDGPGEPFGSYNGNDVASGSNGADNQGNDSSDSDTSDNGNGDDDSGGDNDSGSGGAPGGGQTGESGGSGGSGGECRR